MAKGSLTTYQQKRDFAKSPEPAGLVADDEGHRFVIHKHLATADHYDLRLEIDGVPKSWAIPKGPSLNPADKRYAAETEDHPVDYIDFEGVIPEGENGGGPMIGWDTGTWAPMGAPAVGRKAQGRLGAGADEAETRRQGRQEQLAVRQGEGHRRRYGDRHCRGAA